jgi:hypothetical protein
MPSSFAARYGQCGSSFGAGEGCREASLRRLDCEGHIDVAPHRVRVRANRVVLVHQRLGLLPRERREGAYELDGEPVSRSVELAVQDAPGPRVLAEVDRLRPRDVGEGAAEAGRVAPGEELLRVRSLAARTAKGLRTERGRSSLGSSPTMRPSRHEVAVAMAV